MANTNTPEYKLATLTDMAEDIAVMAEKHDLDEQAIAKIEEAYKAISDVHSNTIVNLNEAAVVDAGTQVKRLATLARLGLVDRNVIPTLSKLLKTLDNEKAVLTPIQRQNALKLLNGLIDLVTGDMLFNKAVAAERSK